MTAAGGRIVVTCPFAFTNTPLDAHFPPSALHAGFGAVACGVLQVEELTELDWPLRSTERLTHVHRTDAMVFRKAPAGGWPSDA